MNNKVHLLNKAHLGEGVDSSNAYKLTLELSKETKKYVPNERIR